MSISDYHLTDADISDAINNLCDKIDKEDPQIHALLPEKNRRERLLRDAEDLKIRYPDPEKRPLLFGVPIGVKDIFRTEGFITRAGSLLPEDEFKGREAGCVTRLKRAGALILGKTVTTEFAYFEPGPTRNPHNPKHTPGGSSSGSAAAVASGFCQLALGSQTVGSVIRPAAFCGTFGFKPSFGRIPTGGVIPFSKSADHIGYFTSDVSNIERTSAVICRKWSTGAEPYWNDGKPVIGVPEGAYLQQASREGLEAFEKQMTRIEHAGYRVKRVRVLDDINEVNRLHRLMIAAEISAVHKYWFPKYKDLYRERTAEIIKEGRGITRHELIQAKRNRLRLRTILTRAMRSSGIDVWACPSAPGTAPRGIHATGDPAMNLPWTHTGVPAINIPAGFSENGLPFGLQLTAGYLEDEMLVAAAAQVVGTVNFT